MGEVAGLELWVSLKIAQCFLAIYLSTGLLQGWVHIGLSELLIGTIKYICD